MKRFHAPELFSPDWKSVEGRGWVGLNWFSNRLQASKKPFLSENGIQLVFSCSLREKKQGLGFNITTARTRQPEICLLGIAGFKICVEQVSFLVSLPHLPVSHTQSNTRFEMELALATLHWHMMSRIFQNTKNRSDLEQSFCPSLCLWASQLEIWALQHIYSVIWFKYISIEKHTIMY